MNVASGGTQPTHSKNDEFYKIERPNTWEYICMIIVFLDYTAIFFLYELDIRPWRDILLKQPQPGKLSQKEEMGMIHKLWTPEEHRLL